MRYPCTDCPTGADHVSTTPNGTALPFAVNPTGTPTVGEGGGDVAGALVAARGPSSPPPAARATATAATTITRITPPITRPVRRDRPGGGGSPAPSPGGGAACGGAGMGGDEGTEWALPCGSFGSTGTSPSSRVPLLRGR